MKALKKNDMGVSPVIAVILMVAITVVLAGVVFLWAQSFTDDASGDVEAMNVKASIDATTNTVVIEVISGTISWDSYTVSDGTVTDLTIADGTSTSAGGTATFSGGAYTSAQEYTIKIVNVGENKVVWEDDIIAV